MRNLPEGWLWTDLETLAGKDGIASDGDWVESKDQNPEGDVRLLQLADIGEGKFINKSRRFMDTDRAEKMNCMFLKKGDLLIARLGDPVGKACILPEQPQRCVTAVDVMAFRPCDAAKRVQNYVPYVINSPRVRNQINEQLSGTTRKRITGKKLKKTKFPLPPLAEQERIVDKIDELFSAIEAGERAIERARIGVARYRKAILKAAVTGELTKDWRDENPAKESAEALLARILTARYEAWEKAELEKLDAKGKARPETGKQWEKFKGRYKPPAEPEIEKISKIPLNWAWSTLDQLVKVETGATPKKGNKEYYENGTVPWVTSTAVNSRNISKENDLITDKAIKETNAKVFPIGTLIIAMYGEGKTRGKVARLAIAAATNQACAALLIGELDQQTIDYIEIFFLQAYNRMRSKAAGGVQPNLNLSMIRETRVALPPQKEQAEIVDRAEKALSKATAVEATLDAQSRAAKALKQAVLKSAFEGKLVPQNPNDEPASELLKRIKEET